jgi:NAD(P)-dependent dehydrogenase (short-subunit alcohol dehydrogenase family)
VLSLITGVGKAGQVGQAVAAALARRGDQVLLVARSQDEAMARAAELVAAGGMASGFACDLADPAAVERLAAQVRTDHGERLDNLVNLAGGFGASGPLAQSDPATVARQFSINASTAYLTTRAFFPSLRVTGGSIVFFASEAVIEGARSVGVAAYAMSKSAVVALMRSVADEGREAGIRANALAPGSIRTATNEASMGKDVRYVEREDVASVVAFLCSPAAQSITGQVFRLR